MLWIKKILAAVKTESETTDLEHICENYENLKDAEPSAEKDLALQLIGFETTMTQLDSICPFSL